MKEGGETSQRTHIPLDKDNSVVMARAKVGLGAERGRQSRRNRDICNSGNNKDKDKIKTLFVNGLSVLSDSDLRRSEDALRKTPSSQNCIKQPSTASKIPVPI